MKELKRHEADLMRTIIDENNAIFKLDNKRYYLSIIEIHEPDIKTDHSNNVKTKKEIDEKKLDIMNGSNFSIDDVVEMIDLGVL